MGMVTNIWLRRNIFKYFTAFVFFFINNKKVKDSDVEENTAQEGGYYSQGFMEGEI